MVSGMLQMWVILACNPATAALIHFPLESRRTQPVVLCHHPCASSLLLGLSHQIALEGITATLISFSAATTIAAPPDDCLQNVPNSFSHKASSLPDHSASPSRSRWKNQKAANTPTSSGKPRRQMSGSCLNLYHTMTTSLNNATNPN